MARKKFSAPFILFNDDPGDDIVIGGGTGQSTTDTFVCSYDEWLKLFADNYDMDDEEIIDFNDYGQWWADNGFSVEDWERFNPGVPFEWE